MAAKEKVSSINSNFINNVSIRSINLLPSLQLTDQPTLRYSSGWEQRMSYKIQCECTKMGGQETVRTIWIPERIYIPKTWARDRQNKIVLCLFGKEFWKSPIPLCYLEISYHIVIKKTLLKTVTSNVKQTIAPD